MLLSIRCGGQGEEGTFLVPEEAQEAFAEFARVFDTIPVFEMSWFNCMIII